LIAVLLDEAETGSWGGARAAAGDRCKQVHVVDQHQVVREQRRSVAAQQRRHVEPEAGECRAAKDSVPVAAHRLVAPAGQHEPVDLGVVDPVREVLPYAAAPVDAELVAQVIARAAGRDLDDELWWAFDVALGPQPRGSAALGRQSERHVRLWFVVEVEPQGRVVGTMDPGRAQCVEPTPDHEQHMGFAVPGTADGRRHVDHSLGELRLLAVRHRSVAAFELVARQPVTGAKSWNAARAYRRSRHHQEWNGDGGS
jgi:hypothetical protein